MGPRKKISDKTIKEIVTHPLSVAIILVALAAAFGIVGFLWTIKDFKIECGRGIQLKRENTLDKIKR